MTSAKLSQALELMRDLMKKYPNGSDEELHLAISGVFPHLLLTFAILDASLAIGAWALLGRKRMSALGHEQTSRHVHYFPQSGHSSAPFARPLSVIS